MWLSLIFLYNTNAKVICTSGALKHERPPPNQTAILQLLVFCFSHVVYDIQTFFLVIIPYVFFMLFLLFYVQIFF